MPAGRAGGVSALPHSAAATSTRGSAISLDEKRSSAPNIVFPLGESARAMGSPRPTSGPSFSKSPSPAPLSISPGGLAQSGNAWLVLLPCFSGSPSPGPPPHRTSQPADGGGRARCWFYGGRPAWLTSFLSPSLFLCVTGQQEFRGSLPLPQSLWKTFSGGARRFSRPRGVLTRNAPTVPRGIYLSTTTMGLSLPVTTISPFQIMRADETIMPKFSTW